MRFSLVLALLLSGCIAGFGDTNSSVEGGELEESCKIEGSQIGKEGVTLLHKSRAATFRNWVPKAGSPGEYVGFTLDLDGTSSIRYRVKASTQVYPSTSTTWLSPNTAAGGSSAPGISNVELCDCDCPCSDGGGGSDGSTDGGGGTDGGGDGGGDSGPIIL